MRSSDINKKLPGFWLPEKIRDRFINDETPYNCYSAVNGFLTDDDVGFSICYPVLSAQEISAIINLLKQATPIKDKTQYVNSFIEAFKTIIKKINNREKPFNRETLSLLSKITGYSENMLDFFLSHFEFPDLKIDLNNFSVTKEKGFYKVKGIEGGFFYLKKGIPLWYILKRKRKNDVMVCFAAGNAAGTGLLFYILAEIVGFYHKKPALIIKNSRTEPLFSSLLLDELEKINPDFVSNVALLIWDYNNKSIQNKVIEKSDIVMAAASDFTIDSIQSDIKKNKAIKKAPNFQKHGHKVSFSAIGKDFLSKKLTLTSSDNNSLLVLSQLAAIDSIYWDQNACLSSRVHFIEDISSEDFYSPLDYAESLVKELRELSLIIPKGMKNKKDLHYKMDNYSLLENDVKLKILSDYEDDFMVIFDKSNYALKNIKNIVNDCMGRTIFVVPVKNLLEIPRVYLKKIPSNNLQTITLATHLSLNKFYIKFMEKMAKRGITNINALGGSVTPAFLYSWDGYMPFDLIYKRSSGYFTSFSFDNPIKSIEKNYQIIEKALNRLR